MSLLCQICGDRIKLPKKRKGLLSNLGQFVSTKYCSVRCQFANLRYILLAIGVIFIAAYVAIGIPLYQNDPDLWWLFIIMFPLPFIGLIGLIGGLISLNIYITIKKRLKQEQFYCYNCGYNITHSSNEGSLLCDSCGNKVLYCSFCSKIINSQEQIAVIKPCNHVFHKGELLDYVEDNYSCPKCQGEIKELAFKIDKDDEEFWVKSK